MPKQLSIIIPTLQKNPLFHLLLDNLHNDECIKEIIIINNSMRNINFTSPKLKILEVEENIFVNPAWNLGIKHSTAEYCCLMNDDIMLCKNFCNNVLNLLNPDMGVVGILGDFVKYVDESSYANAIIATNNISLKAIYHLCYSFGIAIFGHRNAFVHIPEELKVFYGDNYLIHANIAQGKKCYAICNQEIYHLGSHSSKAVAHLGQEEKPIYEKYRKIYDSKLALKKKLNQFKV